MKIKLFNSALTVALLVTTLPASGQRSNWIDVAHSLGGSGRSADGAYVRLVESEAWGVGSTPPIWILFEPEGKNAPIRGSIPVLRSASAKNRAILVENLPEGSTVLISNIFGVESPKVSLRFETEGLPKEVAAQIRGAIMEIEPGALKRVRGVGVIERDSMDCEEFWTLKTDHGEYFEMKKLPLELQVVGMRLSFHLERKNRVPGSFSYFGGTMRWTGQGTPIALRKVEAPLLKGAESQESISGELLPRWAELCEVHARTLLANGGLNRYKLATVLADGFSVLGGPGFHVCPTCRRPLERKRLLKGSAQDQVLATLHSCFHDKQYFCSQSGSGFGPVFPTLELTLEKPQEK